MIETRPTATHPTRSSLLMKQTALRNTRAQLRKQLATTGDLDEQAAIKRAMDATADALAKIARTLKRAGAGWERRT